mgnify:CR=1
LGVRCAAEANGFHLLSPGTEANLTLRKMAGHRSANFLLIARGH